MLKNIIKHIILVTKHKWNVFKLCCRVGLPWRGLVHDLSKFSPTEFWESAKYYQGNRSPITACREIKGYSEAVLHHVGRNKHHVEYWIDMRTKGFVPVIPYKYAVEMVCDKMSATIVYCGKNFTNSSAYDYWMKEKQVSIVNPKTENFITAVLEQVKEQGVKKTYTKNNFKKLYQKYCVDDLSEYEYQFKGEWVKIEGSDLK